MAISVSLNGENFEQIPYKIEADFEQLVANNAQSIFGSKAIYIDTKKKINTLTLGGAIPDGFLIDLTDPDDSQFYLVEAELHNHDFYNHIFPQITKFFAFYRDSKQRHKLIETMFELFKDDPILSKKIKDLIGSKEIYKFLKDTIDHGQNILIVIDGPKAEFKEIMETYTDTWGKMVKVQTINHFKKSENNILTVEPPFIKLSFGGSSEKEIIADSKYTEQIHLENCNETVKNIYTNLKKEFLTIKNTLEFKPVQGYIGVRDNSRWHPHRENIAAIFIKRKKLWLFCWLSEIEANKKLGSHHHKVLPEDSESCYIEICDTSYWDEIQKLLLTLVERTSGLKNK